MDFLKAQTEFKIRKYLWSKMKAAEEIKESFPHFWLFKGGTTWKCYHFMKSLDESEQKIFASGLLKVFHRDAARALGETITLDEQDLRDRFWSFSLLPSPLETEVDARIRMGEKVVFASKRKVRNAMIKSFKIAFDGWGSELIQRKGDPNPSFRMKFGGWILQTNFGFGRGRTWIEYNQLIMSQDQLDHPNLPGVTYPAMVLDCLICWIGLGRMEWDYLSDEDIEPACDSVVTLCREFFDELPHMLKGLERNHVMLA